MDCSSLGSLRGLPQRRAILRAFRQATAERAQAEADADAQRKREPDAATTALNKARQEAEAQRSKATADAEGRRRAERVAAEATLSQTRQTADNRLAEAHKVQEQARDSVDEADLGDLLNAPTPTPTWPQPGADPAQGFARAVTSADEALEAVQDGVAALIRWRQETAVRRRRLMYLGAAAPVAMVVVIILGVQTAQRAAERRASEATRQALAAAAIQGGPVSVPAGEFLMGSTDADRDASDDEKPQRSVYLDAYLIDRTEVTNAMYAKCVAASACKAPWRSGPYKRSYYSGSRYANYPVIYVSWEDAQAYCKWAGGRLPTEAEWEKAARGTDGLPYPWGNESPDAQRANYGSEIGDTTAVGAYPTGASPYGALDMAGNVWEWVVDWYDEKYYARASARNPQGPGSGQYRVLRGGSWDGTQRNVRAAVRNWSVSGYRNEYIGFRCVRSP